MRTTYFLLLFAAIIVLFSRTALAALPPPPPPAFSPVWHGTYDVTCNETSTPCTACDAVKVMINLTNFASLVIFPIVGAICIYGGLQMLLSSGSEERFRGGKKTLMSGVIGLVIILSSWLLINEVLHLFLGSKIFDWSQITC